MSRIRSRDTKPEMTVRRHLHAAGLRYRLHATDLPGTPDIVFPGRHLALFVHGCFWHGCRRCRDGRKSVKSNTAYWHPKLRRIRERDARNAATLAAAGWHVCVIWECETRRSEMLLKLVESIRAIDRNEIQL